MVAIITWDYKEFVGLTLPVQAKLTLRHWGGEDQLSPLLQQQL